VNRHCAVLIFVQFFWYPITAQIPGEKLPLQEALGVIEKQYQVTFSYADENVFGIFVIPPSPELTLSQTLDYLRQHTGLNFQPLSDDIISVNKPLQSLIDFCGTITDADSGEAIAGATIQVGSLAGISNDHGFFQIKSISQSDTILVRYVGYTTLQVPVGQNAKDSCVHIFMSQNTIKLQEVVVSNFIIKGIDINSDGAIRIDAITMGILPGLTDPDVLQTIQAMPGIQSINETVSDINVRGGTNDQNLIFWNGIKMYQSGHFFGMISGFNPYLTEKVILIKNGTTTSLSDGVSSTIDIHTEDRVNKKFSGGAGVNMINADLFLKIPLAPKVSLQLSGRKSISDMLETPTYEQYFDRVFGDTDVTDDTSAGTDSIGDSNQQFSFYDVTAKLLYDITPEDKLRINFLSINNRISYEENGYLNNVYKSKTSGLEQHSLAGAINYHRLWSDIIQTNAQLYFSGYELEAINYDVSYDQRLIQENKVMDTGLKLDARIALSNTLDIFTGYQFYEVGISNLEDINNPTFRRLIKRVLRSHAAFAEVNYSSKSHDTNLRFGLRGNYFEKFNRFIPEPRVAFNQKFLSHFSFELLGEMKSQFTNQIIDFQNDFLGVEKRRWVLANEEDIPIAQSRQISAGLRYQQGGFLISVDGFNKFVEGITSSSQGFQNQFQYVRSAGSYHVTGVDVLLNQSIGKLTTWLSYSFADNQYNFAEFNPSVFPNNIDIRHTATLGSSYQMESFQVSSGINWRTGKPFTQGLGVENGEVQYDIPNSSRLQDYLRVDVSAKYWFRFSDGVKGEIGASIWNLLNTENIINQFYQIDSNDNLTPIQQYALGFTPNVMLRVSF
jgi:hypothetical protein